MVIFNVASVLKLIQMTAKVCLVQKIVEANELLVVPFSINHAIDNE